VEWKIDMKMNDNNKTDLLENLFGQMAKEPLPASFRSNVMQQILAEAIRVKKRNERLGLIAVIVASVIMLALAIAALVFLGVPKISFRVPDLTSVPFFLYIGGLAFLLLWFDHIMRRKYKEKHKEE